MTTSGSQPTGSAGKANGRNPVDGSMEKSDEGVVPVIRRRQPPKAGEGRPKAEGNQKHETIDGILCPIPMSIEGS